MTSSACSKFALVTGSTAGIGRCVAECLARNGWQVILACRNLERGRLVAREIIEKLDGGEGCGSVEVGPRLDLGSIEGIEKFANSLGPRPIHLLVNNAGTSVERWTTSEGVPGVVQVNYIGPYLLTRLLLANLTAARPSRVVNVASVMHRFADMSSVTSLLRDQDEGVYARSKLALVLFTHELQRRVINHGIDCHAVDPGAVNTDIFSSTLYSMFPFNKVLGFCYAPPEDGCQAVVHASMVKSQWPLSKSSSEIEVDTSREDIRALFFARGLFASYPVTHHWEYDGIFGFIGRMVHKTIALCLSLLDYPIRRVSGNRYHSRTLEVEPARISYDTALAAELWEETAHLVGLPEDI